MKWTSATLNLSHVRKTFQSASSVGKTFFILSTATLAIFVLIGVGGYLQNKVITTSPVSSMKSLAASVTNQFFIDMLGMEVPHLNKDQKKFTFSQHNVFHFAFQFLTDINPSDPKSLVASEVPGMDANKTTVLVKGSGSAINPSDPFDYSPNPSDLEAEAKYPHPSLTPEPSPASTTPVVNTTGQPPKTAGDNVAFIYQTHSNESFLPELKGVTDPDKAYSDKVNIISVGQRLAQNLEKDGIGAVHSQTVYPSTVKNFEYPYSYKYSLKTLQEAMVQHPDLQYYFDIHRDSAARNKTTATIDGKDYAQVYFIIGGKNPNWKKNEEFANKIHQVLEAKHPGISKGIHAKEASEGNGLYNQNISPNNILIEVGGPFNSLEECYRTTDWLADAISEVILNAKKVDAPAASPKQS
ncbi:stage II sporulation protein P [Paenibacillus aceris]|uniref:Stage II sporulation protein P n=1 Tax=Paenibacillus aceris TaxID=869555 RepID=A0ABS4HSG6_9BACL|nr:stage II sporulation protein P [Paenibacillus aceris]MBP1961500.1 stage II sporulation protein P [Paenibacillus aceris]NHW37722.1 stage II sporulation protein P [Paenibacillus aceris]